MSFVLIPVKLEFSLFDIKFRPYVCDGTIKIGLSSKNVSIFDKVCKSGIFGSESSIAAVKDIVCTASSLDSFTRALGVNFTDTCHYLTNFNYASYACIISMVLAVAFLFLGGFFLYRYETMGYRKGRFISSTFKKAVLFNSIALLLLVLQMTFYLYFAYNAAESIGTNGVTAHIFGVSKSISPHQGCIFVIASVFLSCLSLGFMFMARNTIWEHGGDENDALHGDNYSVSTDESGAQSDADDHKPILKHGGNYGGVYDAVGGPV